MQTQAPIKTQQQDIPFEEDQPRQKSGTSDHDDLLLNIDGYEGPISVLLEMARKQKVDLRQISILQLARQYLAFIERAAILRLDLAAEYLVMAAWLAYLKSRLLVPNATQGEEPSAEEMADALQFQLQRLEAMQNAAERLFQRPQLGQDVFPRGYEEDFSTETTVTMDCSLFDLIKIYGDIQKRMQADQAYDLPSFNLMSTEDAMTRLEKMLGRLPRKGKASVWATLHSFMPDDIDDPIAARSILASTLTAGLEMAKQGALEIRQDGLFRPIYMRQKDQPHDR